jgi:hypothetical protein
MLLSNLAIPLLKKLHGRRRANRGTLTETDPQQFPIRIVHEVPNSLEPTCVSSPTACAGYTPGERIESVHIWHAARKL